MAFNPQKRQELLDNPIDRANPLNDPDYVHEEGYNPFNLTRPIVSTYRYGEASPISVFDVISADRHRMRENLQVFVDEIQKRVLNSMYQYVDYFHVPYRSIFPINYDKIIVNPNKGDDVPLLALPQIPLMHLLRYFLSNNRDISLYVGIPGNRELEQIDFSLLKPTFYQDIYLYFEDELPSDNGSNIYPSAIGLSRLLYFCFIMSRGQLLDNLDFALDDVREDVASPSYRRYKNKFQENIDKVFNHFGEILHKYSDYSFGIAGVDLSYDNGLTSDVYRVFLPIDQADSNTNVKTFYSGLVDGKPQFDLTQFRACLYECMDKGLLPLIFVNRYSEEYGLQHSLLPMDEEFDRLYDYFLDYLQPYVDVDFDNPDADSFFDAGFINPSRIVAYQQSMAEYQSNDHVDNVFTSELWMQNMRAIMYPSTTNLTTEPTFKYNGVDTEYDMFTTGGFRRAWWSNQPGFLTRILPFFSNLLVQRRSLRFRDYFASGRPNMLAVGDLSVQVSPDGTVNPIDMSRGILLARFFNAVNRWRRKTKNYMASLFGVVPSNTGCVPAWIIRHQNQFGRDTVANQSGDLSQGRIATNLVSSSSDQSFDIFIDDFGVVIGVLSFEIQAYYPTGIDRSYRHIDRYSLYNPMLQNTGDQEIRLDELTGHIGPDINPSQPFAYATRYAEYKQCFARARGGFVNNEPAAAFVYPYASMMRFGDAAGLRISPDFIRERPFYLDSFKPSLTGLSPAQYYHFSSSINSNHESARKIKKWPGIL